jgi:hypothetical protein
MYLDSSLILVNSKAETVNNKRVSAVFDSFLATLGDWRWSCPSTFPSESNIEYSSRISLDAIEERRTERISFIIQNKEATHRKYNALCC